MKRANKQQTAFTLIELLAVITIMGIVAALVLSMSSAASTAKKRGMVDAEKNRLLAAIDTYQSKLGFYPPDNGNLATTNAAMYDQTAAINPLLYELTGGVLTNQGNTPAYELKFGTPGSTVQVSYYSNMFARGGIANSDPTQPQSFFIPGPLPKDYTNYNTAYTNVLGLVVPVPLTNGQLNFWHYDASSQYRHNPNSYDLWAEFTISGLHGHVTIVTNGNW